MRSTCRLYGNVGPRMTRCVRATRVTLEGLPIAPAPFQAELRWPMGGVRGLIFFGRSGRGAMPRRAACRSWSVRVPHSGTISRRQPACSLLLKLPADVSRPIVVVCCAGSQGSPRIYQVRCAVCTPRTQKKRLCVPALRTRHYFLAHVLSHRKHRLRKVHSLVSW